MDYEFEQLKLFIREKISSIRMSNGISSRKLSLELGKSTEYINQLENNRLNPSLEFLYEFCIYFGITLSDFFNENNAYPAMFNDICQDLSILTSEEVTKVASIIKLITQNKKN
ncbi:MAG: helix-turn-helix domain-containing protein [Firmicutes bacterium]|nr:helix-turn-helix domain-containing protein [Bacillota bacterium]